jgi:hypothetical protein
MDFDIEKRKKNENLLKKKAWIIKIKNYNGCTKN